MPIEYEWSEEVEAAARAIAFVDGWDIPEDAYSVLQIPDGRAAAYWCRAVAAVSAYTKRVEDKIAKEAAKLDYVYRDFSLLANDKRSGEFLRAVTYSRASIVSCFSPGVPSTVEAARYFSVFCRLRFRGLRSLEKFESTGLILQAIEAVSVN